MTDGPEPMNKDDRKSEPEPVHESELEAEIELVPTESCQDDVDIEPLSGKSFCHIILGRSHVGDAHYSYQLVLPAYFTRILPNNKVPVILSRGGKSWETTFSGEKAAKCKRFDTRWRGFVEDNKLKVGDVCVFELMECNDTALEIKVQVLRGDFPSILLDKEDGTINNPIVVE